MEEIYKNTLLLVHSITQLSGICYKYNESPEDDTGEKIIEIIDKCEKKFLQVKEEVVKMVQEVEKREKLQNIEIIGTETENGFLIKE